MTGSGVVDSDPQSVYDPYVDRKSQAKGFAQCGVETYSSQSSS